jgi:hypothetical protein
LAKKFENCIFKVIRYTQSMKSPAVSKLHGFEFKPKPFCFSQNKSQMVFQIFFL